MHGAAHDIAGTGRANPIAAIRSAAMMLDYLGEEEAAARINDAVLGYLAGTDSSNDSSAAGIDDQSATTAGITREIAGRLRRHQTVRDSRS